jgi:hypothetical protein
VEGSETAGTYIGKTLEAGHGDLLSQRSYHMRAHVKASGIGPPEVHYRARGNVRREGHKHACFGHP